jgi:cytochrome b pre-mRNA-processing protein 3
MIVISSRLLHVSCRAWRETYIECLFVPEALGCEAVPCNAAGAMRWGQRGELRLNTASCRICWPACATHFGKVPMSFLSRLLGTGPDPRETVRPLWHRVVELAREPSFYSDCQVADTVAGRFDLITAVLCAVIVRVEASEMRSESALLAELFVEDMDGQLREFGVNDVVVGKRVGKLMSVLGGRLGAYRSALTNRDREKLRSAVQRNVTFSEGVDEGAASECVTDKLLALSERLSGFSDEQLLKASGIW